jgi:hypothetical protein
MKRLLSVILVLALLLIFCNTAEADTGSMVHNGPGHYSGWVQLPWSSVHYYNTVPTYGHTGHMTRQPVKHQTTVTKTKKKRVQHFKSKASKKRFYAWYFATHRYVK